MPGPYHIRVVDGGEFTCGGDERVLLAMERSGAGDIGVGCRGGGCGICRVKVIEGEYRTGKMSAAKVPESDRQAGYALACRLFPSGDLVIAVD